MDHWNQSVPLGEISLPTPSDTISECATSDYQDMSGQPWSQAPLPDEWTTVTAPDHSTLMQSSSGDWSSHSAPVTVQDIQALDTNAWLHAIHGPVDMGLSPVLSQESQSSHTLNSLSEPDSCVLPPRLDLSSAAEPSYHQPGPMMYASPAGASQFSSAFGYTPSLDPSGLSMECSLSASQGLYPGSQPPLFFPQGGHAVYPRRTFSYPVTPTPMRPLLPRTESSCVSGQPVHGLQRALRPQIQDSRISQASMSSVSSPSGQHQGNSQQAVAFGRASSPNAVAPRPAQNLPHGSSCSYQAAVSVQPTSGSYFRSAQSMAYVSDPTAEDFSAFIHFDHEDQTTSPGALRLDLRLYDCHRCGTNELDSYVSGYGVMQSMPSNMSGAMKPVASQPEQDVKNVYRTPNSAAASMASDSDEGRYRSDPLYSKGPDADGMYRCPYQATDPNCPHKPTKLKCNYEYDRSPSQVPSCVVH